MSATHVDEIGNTIAGTHQRTGGHGAPHTQDITGHHSGLAHQFDNMEQQRDATTIAMWVFLVTEIMFFGGMFFAYTLYRATDVTGAFRAASAGLDITLGVTNTAILIGSSLTMAMGVFFAQTGNRRMLMLALVATIILGSAFLGIKAVEYKHKFDHGTFPGANFQFHEEGLPQAAAHGTGSSREAAGTTQASGDGESGAKAHGSSDHAAVDPGRVQMFYVLYFALTGIHALHMIIGIGIMLFLLYYAYKGAYSPEYYAPVELSGLYWHFVDIVWIFLFPLLYLIGRH